jgi:transcriptional regulator with XRE-family HTH domain
MRLGEKLRHLRQVEGQVRGLDRALTKAELVRAMRRELGSGLSHAYLSQLESGARIHLSAHSRALLSGFFKVHPGYLVDDPPGYQTEIASPALLDAGDALSVWLANRAEERRDDPLVYRLLLRLSRHEQVRRYLALFDDLLDLPVETIEGWLQVGAPSEAVAR